MNRQLTLVSAAALLLVAPAWAQRRAAEHTARPALIYSDVLSGRGEFATVILVGRTAYRMEIIPGTARLGIRPLRTGLRPPSITRPLEDPAEAAGGASYLVVPAESGEYRIDVASDEPARVRVVRDPREQALLEGRARSGLGSVSIGVRLSRLQGDIAIADSAATGAGGFAFCLGIARGLLRFAPGLSGCVIAIDLLGLDGGESLTMVGIAPRYHLGRLGSLQVAVAANLGVGELQGPSVGASYQSYGVGLNGHFVTMDRLELEVEPGFLVVRRDSYDVRTPTGQRTTPARSTTVLRLAVGAHIRLF